MTSLDADEPGRGDVLQYRVEAGRRAADDAIHSEFGPGVSSWMLLTETPAGESVLQVPTSLAEKLERGLSRHDLSWKRMEEVPPLGQIQRLNTLVATTEEEDLRRRAKRILADLRNRRSAILAGEVE